MRCLIILSFFMGINLFAENVKTESSPSTEEILPDTVDISNEIVEINQNYIRDIASDLDKEEKVDTETVPFWSFE